MKELIKSDIWGVKFSNDLYIHVEATTAEEAISTAKIKYKDRTIMEVRYCFSFYKNPVKTITVTI